jgi:hypothetical protein
MPTDPYMTELVYPTEDSDEDIWDTILNTTVFPVLGAHDHTTGKGVKVPMAGLNVNADLAFAGYSITGMKALAFTPVAAASIAGYSSGLFANLDDANNLYFRNSSGVNVKIVDGSTLNVSIVGGIGGDYSSVSALLDYDDATDTYRFRQETSASVRQYAKIKSADLVLAEYIAAGGATVPTNFVTLKSPSALAASYSLTMPTALPATGTLMYLDAAGQVATTGTIDQSITFASNRNITLAGTGVIKHGTWRRGKLCEVSAVTGGSVSVGATGTGSQSACIMAASTSIWIDISDLIEVGESLTSVTIYTEELSGTANSTFNLLWDRPVIATFGSSLLAAAAVGRPTLPTPQVLTINGSYTYVAGDVVRVTVDTAAASTRANFSVYVDVTRA